MASKKTKYEYYKNEDNVVRMSSTKIIQVRYYSWYKDIQNVSKKYFDDDDFKDFERCTEAEFREVYLKVLKTLII